MIRLPGRHGALASAFAAVLFLATIGSIGASGRSATQGASARSRLWVLLNERADLSSVMAIPDPAVRRRRLAQTLQETARTSQASLRSELVARGYSVRSFWIVNALLVTGDTEVARELAARRDVERVVTDAQFRMQLPQPVVPPTVFRRNVSGVTWNVARVGAPEIWQQEGVQGEGVVIAIADTGIQWDHTALVDRERLVSSSSYRFYLPLVQGSNRGKTTTITSPSRNHDYAWHDAIASTEAPLDDHGHGTHVAGIAVGDGGPAAQIGVAPGAEWVACRNMESGVGRLSSYVECFEWFLAPTRTDGSDPRPDLAPHIVSNSWTCPVPLEDCTDEVLDIMRESVQRLRDAGILVVAAAGNDGPACETIEDPPAIYEESFTVGATTSSDTLATFSSRGPVTRDGSGRLKPDLVAPGVGVYSSYPPDTYGILSGTSMATPAISGVAALVWSAVPHLRGDVTLTERILRETADPTVDTSCGGESDGHPNNAWGWGLVDAVAAVELAKTCPASGDWDGDGAITQRDVDRVAESVGQPVGPETAAFDLNGDSMIAVTDIKVLSARIGESCQWNFPHSPLSGVPDQGMRG